MGINNKNRLGEDQDEKNPAISYSSIIPISNILWHRSSFNGRWEHARKINYTGSGNINIYLPSMAIQIPKQKAINYKHWANTGDSPQCF